MSDSMYGTGQTSLTTVTGFFDTRPEAEAAAERLRALGMGLRVQITEGAQGSDTTRAAPDEDRGFFEKLGDFFFPEDDRSTYAEGLSRGGHLLVATDVPTDSLERVADEMETAGAIDIDEREERWRSEGWSGQSQGAAATSAGAAAFGSSSSASFAADRDGASEDSVPVVEERLRVGKRDVSHGRVRIRSYVVEEPVSETVQLESDRVEIDRRAVDRPVTGADADLFRDRVIEAEETREEAIVAKEARVVEEVSLRRTHETEAETISDTVRHTEVEIADERGTTSGARSGRSGLSEYEAETGRPDDDAEDTLRPVDRDRGM